MRSSGLVRRSVVAAILCGMVMLAIPGVSVIAAATWTLDTTTTVSSTSQNNYLYSTSCVSSSFCMAVGYFNTGTADQTYSEYWNGSSWNQVLPQNPGTGNNELESVSCVSSTFCMAVGQYIASNSYDSTLVETWNGSGWTTDTTAPEGISSQNNYLSGVDCVSASQCVAVGNFYGSTTNQALILSWNGTWTVTTSGISTSATQFNTLSSVSCPTSSTCFAAGYYSNGTVDQTLVDALSAGTWSIVASTPNAGTSQNNKLLAIACPVTTTCMATGYYVTTVEEPLALVLASGSWSLQDPTAFANNAAFYGVSCIGSSLCIAGGFQYVTASSTNQSLIEEYSGGTWTADTSANSSTAQNNYIYGVSCSSTGYCKAVGYHSGAVFQNIAEYAMYGIVVTATVNPGTLSFVNPPGNMAFPALTLTGTNLVTTTTETFDVGDNTGSGAGWNISLSATPFTNGVQTLAPSDFTAAAPSGDTCDTGVTCTLASFNGTYPYTLPATGSTTKLVSAAAGTGMSNQTFSMLWTAQFPANSYAGSYSSTWTLTLASGP